MPVASAIFQYGAAECGNRASAARITLLCPLLQGFSLPGDVSASQHYWIEDIIDPEVEVTARGTIEVPQNPGIGYSVRRDRVETLTVRRNEWVPHINSSSH
jgi:L-alanine-DL-glutamate epimerase-like enolase superfamily enzyme